MSYSLLPAEEDDYDSEDGFIGNDYGEMLDEHISSLPGNQSGQSSKFNLLSRSTLQNQLTESHHGGRNGFEDGSSHTNSREEIRESRKWEPSKIRASLAAYGAQLSVEDFQKAASKGSLEVVEKCLDEAGLSVNEPLQSGWTALMYAANHGQAAIVEYLLSRGADPNYHADMFTALMAACNASSEHNENIGKCVKMLIKAGVDVNAKDRYHMTPLMMACREGHLSAVKKLLRAGADVNQQDSRGWTALTMAAQRQRRDIVVQLLDSGSNPDIPHLDKLTVKDLAAHLPTDEMLALLERRPPNTSKRSVSSSFKPNHSENVFCTLEGGNLDSKLTDLRYGELEVFLLGLDLAFLVPLFQEQLIDLNLLMNMTDRDLIHAGVTQVGARKKLLDAVQAVHKKDWEPSSLVSIHYNRQVKCSDAVAMVANSSKHLRYIGSTIMYVKEHLRRHPDSLLQPTDKVSPTQLLRHTDDALKNVQSLYSQLQSLRTALSAKVKGHNSKPPDAIEFESHRSEVFTTRNIVLLCLLALSVPVFVLYRRGRLLRFFKGSVPSFHGKHHVRMK